MEPKFSYIMQFSAQFPCSSGDDPSFRQYLSKKSFKTIDQVNKGDVFRLFSTFEGSFCLDMNIFESNGQVT